MNSVETNNTIPDDGGTAVFSKSTDNGFAKKLLAFIHGLDVEFPLSGGETNVELRKNIQYLEDEGSSFIHSGNGGFPLTGA